ncbi:methionine adenosyltransferase 2 subunit beta [Caerostris extrusa]|uniref:Methionine adenosyltransferase 2 subunit beta n=1 Tax=Caerostris extrusa TaxID=172846 RepID=A0AAV4ULW4_CAEEX|nr:methionine adenosyltransferase 2 subunit beta [Caerostris extrusa]
MIVTPALLNRFNLDSNPFCNIYDRWKSKSLLPAILVMNVLITGASGLLGRAVGAEFKKHSWKVLGLAYSRIKDDLVKVDLNDFEAVSKIIYQFKPHVIIHCAAERSVDKVTEDYENSKKLNVDVSKHLAKLAGDIKAIFVFISTDYVFSGESPPYKEDDQPSPLNLYGDTKLEAEKRIAEINPDSMILRIPVLYGDEEYIGESAISSLIKLLLKKVPTKVSNYEIRYPSNTVDIASIIFQLVMKKLQDHSLKGIFHWCGMESFTKYEMIKVIAEVHGISYDHLSPDNNPSPGSKRPKNSQLSCKRLQDIGLGMHTSFTDGVKCFGKFFN